MTRRDVRRSRRWWVVVVLLLLVGCDSSGQPRPVSSAQAPAGEQQLSIPIDSVTRHLLIERPTAGAHNRPLIIFLHGSQSSGQQIRDELDLDDMAARAGVLVAFPDGDPTTHSWRTGCCNAYASGSVADFTFVARIIDTLVADGEADPRHIVLGGFSAGALFANTFACRMPQKVSAVVSVSGSLLEPPAFVSSAVATAGRCTPAHPVTVLEVHGTADPTIPAAGSTSACSDSPCEPGVNGFLAAAAVVNGWWRRLDHCGRPVVRIGATSSTSLAACAGGTKVGLALVKGAAHVMAQLRTDFALRETLLQLALAQPLTAW